MSVVFAKSDYYNEGAPNINVGENQNGAAATRTVLKEVSANQTMDSKALKGTEALVDSEESKLFTAVGKGFGRRFKRTVCDIPTDLITYKASRKYNGKEESDKASGDCDDSHSQKENKRKNILVCVIPGNPGVLDYYIPFMDTLYEQTNHSVDIVAVGHAGHSPIVHDIRAYDLQQQIQHKYDNIVEELNSLTATTNAPQAEDYELVLVGHSVGAHICMELLRYFPEDRVRRVCHLFPTVQEIGNSPSGIKLTPVFNYLKPVVAVLGGGVGCTPEWLLKRILSLHFGGWGGSKNNSSVKSGSDNENVDENKDHPVSSTMGIFHYRVIYNALFMAADEMKKIKYLDEDHVEKHQRKMVFYFGENDHWVPEHVPGEIEKKFPEAKIMRCEEGHKHAFVLDSGPEMGTKVANWI
eukprot:Nk52_evm13s2152 gene=Nk52_evmTU13s2152